MNDTPARVTLEDLAAIVAFRASGAGEGSYTRSLIAKGVAKCAQKLGEEAVETALAAVGSDTKAVVSESADLLYHLVVLLQARGVSLEDVYAELGRRTNQSGLEEKASRPRG
ncbi:phosphoribosyl-ATP diphosphatase [Ancylobacter dichloromethanicus]|uniref:Phosphoribosyl-ATP pyrophosphatase n=1 Tax=Ancylobacter dichloromethanicus TaxID=518825 RepID=A0A9W6JCE8_9HYPH|nr:phosphoribosyl-ATP diphosphatase [Ancylobacter dichloromethanicus]MBS7554901.1 phosphoribosyl-ATP diphosphatase [Ancylobacter dichloromethanicus]GLK73295.1 phosphoribosyl-ATP pyrophosphatase 1 [Ancylobacter dichloromethanicus]